MDGALLTSRVSARLPSEEFGLHLPRAVTSAIGKMMLEVRMDSQQMAWLKTHRLTHCPPGPYVSTWFPRLVRGGREPSLRELLACHSQGREAVTNVDFRKQSAEYKAALERQADRLLQKAGDR